MIQALPRLALLLAACVQAPPRFAATGDTPIAGVDERAEAAVIAWMRHQTTGYDGMAIPRVKGERREVRRRLARRPQELLPRYRRGEPVGEDCPLKRGLAVDG